MAQMANICDVAPSDMIIQFATPNVLAKTGDTFNCENLPTIRVKSRSTHFYILRNDRYLHSQWQLISNTKVHFWVDPIATSLTRSLNFVTRRDQHADNFE